MTRTLSTTAIIFLLTASPALAIDVTVCAQVVPDDNTGVLQTDLDCSAVPGETAVFLGDRSVLDMNGHSIISKNHGVHCGSEPTSRCEVRNGEISGGNFGVSGQAKRMVVSDVFIHDVAIWGIAAKKKLTVTNVTVLRAENAGIVLQGIGQIKASNVTVSENPRAGMDAKKIYGTNITANFNGFAGVSCYKCVLDGLTAIDNGGAPFMIGAGGGVQAVFAKISNATLTGNVVDGVPVDIDTYARPKVSNVTCDHSRQRREPSSNWGICTAD
jgi:hypothetical protein